jgi:ribosomal protein S7
MCLYFGLIYNLKMLITYNFYNSLVLQKLINQFTRCGKKEQVESLIYRFIIKSARTKNFLAL